MTHTKPFLIGYKLFFGLLGLSAIITEIAVLVERGRFNPVNFFSYFTVEANILAIATLLLSAIMTAAGKNAKLAMLRGATTVYILIVGLGFSLLLAGLENAEFTAVPWNNVVLHYLMPAAVFLDFWLDRPGRRMVFKQTLPWLLFPASYVTYTLIRGVITDWYPYPFLNPSLNGYGVVILTSSGVAVMTLGLVWAVGKLSGIKIRHMRNTLKSS